MAVALGWVFLATRFGYAAAIRRLLTAGDGAALLPGIVVPMVAAVVIIPGIALLPDHWGFAAPIGLPLLAGAALFGLGMQLANGCGSGALYAAGGGSRRMWITLPCFCAGGVLGSLLVPAGERLPTLPAIVLPELLGTWGGLAATLALLGAIAAVLPRGAPVAARPLGTAVLIGVLAGLLFIVAGHPWGITSGLTLAGAQAVTALGIDLTASPYWAGEGARQALAAPWLADDSALADLGFLAGAMIAGLGGHGLQGRWPDARGWAAAALGGLAMGIGARLSTGCNIGAFVSGAASGSLHGFVWLPLAMLGSWLGIRLRPWFRLAV